MNRSPTFPGYETGDYYGCEFDYHADFAQFLKEARNNEGQENLDGVHQDEAGKKQLDGEKKNRKSWRYSLFSWFKSDKRSKTTEQPTNRTTVSRPRVKHVSGPVRVTIGAIRARGPASGPLTGLFSSTRRVEEYEVPYMCLGRLDNPQKLHPRGPVYLVT